MLFRRDLSVSLLGGENLGLGAIRILLAQPFCQNYLKINGMAEGRGKWVKYWLPVPGQTGQALRPSGQRCGLSAILYSSDSQTFCTLFSS